MKPGLGVRARLLATLLGSGLSPVMPGTCGSLLALLPCLLLPPALFTWVLICGVLAASVGSVLLARRLPADDSDPGWFVLDEAAGVWLSALLPGHAGLEHLILAFVLFRVFDMVKPPPLKALERVPGGWGIVLDDLGAGVYALGLTWGFFALIA